MAAAAKHGRRDKGDEHSIHHQRASARAKRLEYDPSYSSARCRFETAPRQCAPQWRCGAHCPSAGRSGWTAASAPGSDRVSETNRQNFSDLEHLGLELLVTRVPTATRPGPLWLRGGAWAVPVDRRPCAPPAPSPRLWCVVDASRAARWLRVCLPRLGGSTSRYAKHFVSAFQININYQM